MFKTIRTSKVTKFIIYYLCIMLFLQITQPMSAYALTEGPSQPEFNSFTPIGTSDMVDLASGDFNYNIPIMDVGGYPINLAYNSGVTMDQEASWVGLGWNLNIGQINRNVRGIPDDFKGDLVATESNLKRNITVGINPYISPQIIGSLDFNPGVGMNVQYNNYHGISATPSFGISFKLAENVSVGMQLSSSNEDGATVTPNVSISTVLSHDDQTCKSFTGSLSPSITYNSRQGLSSFNLSSSLGFKNGNVSGVVENRELGGTLRSGSGSYSFLNKSFTPSKRQAFNNGGITFSFSGGPDLWGVHLEASITASASVQTLKDKYKEDKAYGYEFTDNATEYDLLDFNRDKEQTVVTKNTLVLPVTNYTYDVLTIQGQGVGGMIRPFRGQVGYLYDPKVNDVSNSGSLGVEIEGGAGGHVGASIRYTNSNTYTGNWNTVATPFFKEKKSGNHFNYEKTYYKKVGETRVDHEYEGILNTTLAGSSPITLRLDGNKQATNNYLKKELNGSSVNLVSASNFNSQIKRNQREKRNQVIQKISAADVDKYGLGYFIQKNPYLLLVQGKNHHTAGYIVTDENGSRHVFGETAYNKRKEETTFATNASGNIQTGLVQYAFGENSPSNSAGIDNYYNNIITPAYAHTYLASSVLSSDYEDLSGNGITDDDLGTYTKFEYTTFNNYKWRVPFNERSASYSEGYKTDSRDQKASYLYGEKELKYVTRIITKTHVAFIDLEDRKDGYGVNGRDGGINLSGTKMKRIKSIRLYSKPELTITSGIIQDPINNPSIKPIKIAHFEYDYSLCPDVDNNSGDPEYDVEGTDLNENEGKLTLKKVYFTYRDSNIGRYTPYEFNYDNENPHYSAKSNYDIWGNYMNPSGLVPASNLNTQEFPYVHQNEKTTQDKWSCAWTLSSVELPSGGKIQLTYESDDYKYVQDKRALQMFKVEGVCDNNLNNIVQYLYGNNFEARYVVIKVNDEDSDLPDETIRQKYIGELNGKPIYFNFFLNMAAGQNKQDYVQGYFEMNGEALVGQNQQGQRVLYVPMKHLNREGKSNNSDLVNPISLTGWFFGRKNLHYQVYDIPFNPNSVNVVDIGRSILSNLGAMVEIFTGPNGRLRDIKGCAKNFDKNKSWIRLQEPSGSKLGGGTRVKKIEMFDGWDEMLHIAQTNPTANIHRYKKKYGQEYNYQLENGTSSGVATYEPNVCKENPLVQPFYHEPEKMSAAAYEEKPFGECFFPNATVTYSKVEVKNITAADDDEVINTNDPETRKTRSGKVITHHYTSYDFPTKTDFTPLYNPANQTWVKHFQTNENEVVSHLLSSLIGLKITVNTELNMSQGFVIETNDMNGKVKMQEVQNNAGDLISKVEYKYSTDPEDQSKLNNQLTTIDKDGKATNNHAIGVEYDVINDFRESYANTNVYGAGVNLDAIPITLLILILGYAVPERSEHTQILRTSVTTKVIHRTGILTEKIAYDLGSRVSTKNLAWDSETGQVILTQTANEYDDDYFTLNYPAHWYYSRMGMASENIDIKGNVLFNTMNGPTDFYLAQLTNNPDLRPYLKLGDEIHLENGVKYWVSGYNSNFTRFHLMKRNGDEVNSSSENLTQGFGFKILRSGNRNQQMASMASITLMTNPLELDVNGNGQLNTNLLDGTISNSVALDLRINNASAIEYSEDWKHQCECDLPGVVIENTTTTTNQYEEIYNPYIYNVKGDWRPVKSYAYLTGRNSQSNSNTRNTGYYKSFNPFYKRFNDLWTTDFTNWTFASEVSKYSPYGMELENRDALNRHSSAQYGYKYTLPEAVASNSDYKSFGFDGFEDIDNTLYAHPKHFGFTNFNITNYTQGHSSLDYVISDVTSHTGKYSLQMNPNTKRRLIYYGNENLQKACFSFVPTQRMYTISAWIKVEENLITSYDGNKYFIKVTNVRDNAITPPTVDINFKPSGKIIDGWQKITGEFYLSFVSNLDVYGLMIEFNNIGTNKCYFDDIRIHPVESNMKSFVYDKATKKLMAELDENNYATFYEYDKEGGLIRVKKETERGVFTIQETRSSTRKKLQ